MPQIKVFFVDIGGVLLNYDIGRFNLRVASTFGLSREQADKLFENCVEPLWPYYEKGIVLPYDLFLQCRWGLAKSLPASQQNEAYRNFTYLFFRQAFGNIFRVNRPMAHFLRWLRGGGCKVLLTSNSNPLHYEYKLETGREIFRNVDGTILSHEVGCRKPEEAFWRIALECGGVPPENVFVIDDKADNIVSFWALGGYGNVFTDVGRLRLDLEKLGFNFGKESPSLSA